MRLTAPILALFMVATYMVFAAPSISALPAGTAIVIGGLADVPRCYVFAGAGALETWVESNGVTTGGVPTTTGQGSGLQRTSAGALRADTKVPVGAWLQRCRPAASPPELPDVPDAPGVPPVPPPPCAPFPGCAVPTPPGECTLVPQACQPPSPPPAPCTVVPQACQPPPGPPCAPFPSCAVPPPPTPPCTPNPASCVPPLPCVPNPQGCLPEAPPDLGSCVPSVQMGAEDGRWVRVSIPCLGVSVECRLLNASLFPQCSDG